MALDIETFSNVKGGFPFFKAVGHPLTAPKGRALLARLRRLLGPGAPVDPGIASRPGDNGVDRRVRHGADYAPE